METYGAPALVELWVTRDQFSRASGLLPKTVSGYACQGRIITRGKAGNRQFRLDEEYRKYPVGDIEPIKDEPEEIEEKFVYPTDKRLKNLAWLATRCYMRGDSFSVQLDKIIGKYRESL